MFDVDVRWLVSRSRQEGFVPSSNIEANFFDKRSTVVEKQPFWS
jgi:hypothetical protein